MRTTANFQKSFVSSSPSHPFQIKERLTRRTEHYATMRREETTLERELRSEVWFRGQNNNLPSFYDRGVSIYKYVASSTECCRNRRNLFKTHFNILAAKEKNNHKINKRQIYRCRTRQQSRNDNQCLPLTSCTRG